LGKSWGIRTKEIYQAEKNNTPYVPYNKFGWYFSDNGEWSTLMESFSKLIVEVKTAQIESEILSLITTQQEVSELLLDNLLLVGKYSQVAQLLEIKALQLLSQLNEPVNTPVTYLTIKHLSQALYPGLKAGVVYLTHHKKQLASLTFKKYFYLLKDYLKVTNIDTQSEDQLLELAFCYELQGHLGLFAQASEGYQAYHQAQQLWHLMAVKSPQKILGLTQSSKQTALTPLLELLVKHIALPHNIINDEGHLALLSPEPEQRLLEGKRLLEALLC
jgi:hypothetical protein